MIGIKGMKMPESCGDCSLMYEFSDCSVEGGPNALEMADFEIWDGRHEKCPLVEIENAESSSKN